MTMRIVSVTFESRRDSAPPPGICPILHDLLWAHAVPEAGLEHVRVRHLRSDLQAVCFVRAPSDADAVTNVGSVAGTHLVDQVAAAHPTIRKVRGDGGYRQHLVEHAAQLGIDMEIV